MGPSMRRAIHNHVEAAEETFKWLWVKKDDVWDQQNATWTQANAWDIKHVHQKMYVKTEK